MKNESKVRRFMDGSGILRQLIIGISSGMVTFLGAAGISLQMSGMNLLNFAQGAFLMLGAFICFTIAHLLGFWWALLIAPVGVAIVGFFVEFLMRPLYPKNMLYQLIYTMGIGFIFMDAMRFIWGELLKTVNPPVIISPSIPLMGSGFPVYYIVILTVAAIFAILLWFIFEKTKLGMIFRSIITDREMAGNLGVNVAFLYSIMFMFSVWMAGVAGVLMAPIIGIVAGESTDILFSLLVVIIIGGMTSMRGTWAAALIVGVINALGSLFIPGYYSLIPSGLMIIVLLIKPSGLFVKAQD